MTMVLFYFSDIVAWKRFYVIEASCIRLLVQFLIFSFGTCSFGRLIAMTKFLFPRRMLKTSFMSFAGSSYCVYGSNKLRVFMVFCRLWFWCGFDFMFVIRFWCGFRFHVLGLKQSWFLPRLCFCVCKLISCSRERFCFFLHLVLVFCQLTNGSPKPNELILVWVSISGYRAKKYLKSCKIVLNKQGKGDFFLGLLFE